MAVSGDVSFSQDGAGHAKLHPYVVALVRWCVSCVWGAATVLLHRLMTAPLPPIAASPARPPRPPARPAGSAHLHPEPRVECVVLHAPQHHDADFVFLHGLYGSLENTWRQGDWRSKYKLGPDRVSLRRPSSIPTPCICEECQNENGVTNSTGEENINDIFSSMFKEKARENKGFFQKVLPNEDDFITEKFCSGSMDKVRIVDNYELQAQFVRNLFKNNEDYNNICEDKAKMHNDTPDTPQSNYKCECRECETGNGVYSNICEDKAKTHIDTPDTQKSNYKCECRKCEIGNGVKCVPGCGCICEDCYSPCWPRDWLKEDFPNARIISVNYTSDPHLWRPLWVKGCKRLRLQERAGQMSEQLLSLGVGRVPIVWVAHSKGGLFAKQIYCEAYEAYLKSRGETLHDDNNIESTLSTEIKTECNRWRDNENIINADKENNAYTEIQNTHEQDYNGNRTSHRDKNSHFYEEVVGNSGIETGQIINKNLTDVKTERENEQYIVNEKDASKTENDIDNKNINDYKKNKINTSDVHNEDKDSADLVNEHASHLKNEDTSDAINEDNENTSYLTRVRQCSLEERASLWSKSVGFMFYSVPHRGSALADFKTPITARSIELLEISKDNSQILSLQQRWLRATEPTRPQVRSLVETNRTLMAVLWLRIVSVESADAGVGALCGISVDHREICKPSSRRCVLYTELSNLIHAATNRWRCRAEV